MDLRLKCSPANIIFAAEPLPVFTKKFFVEPSERVVVIFEVLAEDIPPPPAEDRVVFSGDRERRERMAESGLVILKVSRIA